MRLAPPVDTRAHRTIVTMLWAMVVGCVAVMVMVVYAWGLWRFLTVSH